MVSSPRWPPFLYLLLLLLALAPVGTQAYETATEAGDSASPSLSRTVHFDPSLDASISFARTASIQSDYAQSRERRDLGRTLAWIGIGSGAAGLVLGNGKLIVPGYLAYQIGVPILGSGSAGMAQARNLLIQDSGQAIEVQGWIPYGIGAGLQAVSAALAIEGLGLMILAKYEGNAEVESVMMASGLALASGLCLQGIAMTKFSFMARQAEESNRKGPYTISLIPIGTGIRGDLQPGATLAVVF